MYTLFLFTMLTVDTDGRQYLDVDYHPIMGAPESLEARFTYDPRSIEIPVGFVAPYRVNVETGEKCNMPCGFCFADYTEGAQAHAEQGIPVLGPLNTAEIKGLADQARAIGTRQILFGGADPFIRPDMAELIEYADEIGLQVVVDTNAKLLSKRPGLYERVAPHLHQLGLSLDGSTTELHDGFRDTSHSFPAVLDLVERSRDYPHLVKINTIVTAANAGDIPAMVGTLAPYADRINRWSLDQFLSLNRGAQNEDKYAITDERYMDVMREVRRRAEGTIPDHVFGGGLGSQKDGTVMMFGPQGIPYVTVGPKKTYLAGNIRTSPLPRLVQAAQDKQLQIGKMDQRFAAAYYQQQPAKRG